MTCTCTRNKLRLQVMHRAGLAVGLAVGLAGGLTHAGASWAAASEDAPVLEQANAYALIAAFSRHEGTKALGFKRTTLPDNGSHLCEANAATLPPGAVGEPSAKARDLVVKYDAAHKQAVNLKIEFETGSDVIRETDKALLTSLAKALLSKQLASARFAIAGHTDVSGDERINLALSCARAISARNYLVNQGVPPERLGVYGFGSAHPLSDLDPHSAMQRRVEVRREVQTDDEP